MARDKLCVGIDIGASAVKLCQLKRSARGLTVERYGSTPLPPETVVDGTLMDSARVVEALTQLTGGQKLRNRQVALAVSGNAVIVKNLTVPKATREALDASIQAEAEQFIPFDIKDVYLDVQIIGPAAADPGQMDVVLVAAKREIVDEYTSVVIEAGLEPAVCDVDAFAVENAFHANYKVDSQEVVALVNVGSAKTNIDIVARGHSCFTRDLATGGAAFTEAIQKALGVPQEEAEELKLSGRLAQHREAAALAEAMRQVAESITGDIQRSIDFYGASAADPAPARLYLSGGSAQLPALAAAIGDRIGVPVEVLQPFARIAPGAVAASQLAAAGPAAAVAVGLALRAAGDT